MAKQKTAMSDMLVCFTCCIPEQPPPRRRKIDRSMIGLPTNFTHTGHIGSGDMAPTPENNHLNSIQVQMSSKGGYEHLSPVAVDRKLIDVKRTADTTEE